jgi:cyclopropane fatty-acyl-phospholipid synthase-like methyltransferase
MLVKTVTQYWKKLENENLDMCASFTLFRLLNINGAKFKNKNILDIGFGEGQNLIECKKRGSIIHGIELRKEKIKKIIQLTKANKNNFFQCDLNISFPNIKTKFDLIYTMDTFNYLSESNQNKYFDHCSKILKKNAFFLIHYPQMQLLKKKNKDIFDYSINDSIYKNDYFFEKKNPIIFLKNIQIIKLINKNKNRFKFVSSIFDTNTISKNNSSKLTINRFLLFKKK